MHVTLFLFALLNPQDSPVWGFSVPMTRTRQLANPPFSVGSRERSFLASRRNNHGDDTDFRNDYMDDKTGEWKLANDFPMFLNQLAIQSFLVVLGSLRDPHTVRWVDAFTQPIFPDGNDERSSSSSSRHESARNTGTTDATHAITSDENVSHPNGPTTSRLLIFHGIGCLNTTRFGTWNSYFEQLLQQPMESYLVQSHNGFKTLEYEMEVNPASLCARILSVRQQIAAELAHDLGIVAEQMGRHIMDSFWDLLDSQLEEEEDDDDDDDYDATVESEESETTTTTTTTATTKSTTGRKPITMSSGVQAPRKLPPHNLVFLEYSLSERGDRDFSPLRKGNFDLVVLLATQESIHRILNNQQHVRLGPADQAKYQDFLREFYLGRVDSHFEGIQRYGRADDFLEDLLFFPDAVTVDPVRLAEIILNERRQVALEWQAMCQDVPNDHIIIKRLQLDKLLESYSN